VSKYGNKKTTVDGIVFDSRAEARRYQELKLLERAGEIFGLKRQQQFPIIINGMKVCTYIADFTYSDLRKGRDVVEDHKGFPTPQYALKKKLMKAVHGIEILETGAK
jgi:hypothetical protein